MPTVSFYLKNEDYDKWVVLPHKGSFIHNALNPQQAFEDKMVKHLSGNLKGLGPIVKPIKNPKTIGVPDMFSRVELVEPMEEKIVDGVKMKGADTTNGYYLEAEVVKTPARKALKPLTKGHVTYFKKGK